MENILNKRMLNWTIMQITNIEKYEQYRKQRQKIKSRYKNIHKNSIRSNKYDREQQ
jgi:hypothetical protein